MNYPENCMAVLLCIQETPKSAREIATELNTHVSNIYRTLEFLQRNNMLIVSGNTFSHGKYRLFKSKHNSEHLEEKLQELFTED